MNYKIIFFILFFIFSTISGYSLTDSEKINIDNLIKLRKISDIDKILKNEADNKEKYSEIESYLMKKVKELITANKINDAKVLIKIVLDNNLDNSEAQDIYLSLEKIKNEDKADKAKKISFDNFQISFNIGALDFMLYQSGIYNEHYEELKANAKYGLSTDFNFLFYHPYIATGIDFSFDSYFASIYPEKSGTEFFYRIVSQTTTPLMKVPLYFCFGFANLIYNFDEKTRVDVLMTNTKSLVLGLKLHRWFFNKYIGIDASTYYYLVSPFTSYFNAAFDASFGLLYRFYTINRLGLIVKSEIIGFFLFSNGKLENNVKLQISFGMGLNEK